MKKQKVTFSGMDPPDIEPLTIEQIKRIRDALKPPPKQNVYINPSDYERLINGFDFMNLSADCINPDGTYKPLAYQGVKIIPDPDAPPGTGIVCSAEHWQVFKELKRHPLVCNGTSVDDLLKFANTILQMREEEAKK